MAVILGSIAFDPRTQNTVDLYYLTDSVGGVSQGTGLETTKAFKIDFANSPSGFWLDGFRPGASDIGKGLVEFTIVNNLPISLTTFSISPGHVSLSYLNDFYFRIHLNKYKITLGNILSAQVQTVEVWNAHFINKTLTSITNTGLSDLNLVSPVTLPYTFKALEFRIFTINVPTLGTPAINGSFTFNIGTEAPLLAITGQRIILWPFAALIDARESRQWLTDIIPSRAGEQRFALREIPRLILNYNYNFKNEEEYTLAKILAKTIANLAVAVPLWTEVTKLLNLTSGQSTIFFPTDSLELSIDMPIVFWKDFKTWEIQEISLVFSDRIILKNPLTTNYAQAWLAPVFIGFTNSGIELTAGAGYSRKGSLTMTSTNAFNNPVWTTDIFQSLPVIINTNIASGGIPNKYFREQEIMEVETGLITKFDVETYNREFTKLSLFANNHKELSIIRRQFDFLKGKFTAFWLPSFQNDFTALQNLTTSSTFLRVTNFQGNKFPIKYIRVVGVDSLNNPTSESFEITSIVDNLDGTENMGLLINPTKIINNIKQVQILTKVRLDSDIIDYNHLTKNKTSVNVPVREVLS
jgi:hypothetical protein